MAEDMGFQDICIEGDALTIIHKMNSAEEDRSCIRRRALRASSILDRGDTAYGGDPDKSREEKRHSWSLDREIESGLYGVCLPEELAILIETVVLEGLILGEN
ncbi:hypothetical protein Godav_025857, partial [Gossypium davidsonii]|nr:hypothetical protein [Gossypium davidsonii]